MLIRDGYLYAVQDAGTAVCWKADTGKVAWSGRLGGTFFASPIRVGDHILATNEAGRTYVFRASPAGLKVEAENQLGDEAFASPVACGNRVYLRAATTSGGKRQEWVYCVGKAP